MKISTACVFPVLLLVAVTAACGSKATPNTPAAPIQTTPAIDQKLATADAKDGAVDKVVHKCAGCALGMDGKAEFSMPVGAYQMHFCGDKCLARYKQDALGELGKLDVK